MAKKESNTLANLVKKDIEVEAEATVVETEVETETETAVLPSDKQESAIVVADDTTFGEVGGAEVTSDDLIIPRLIQIHNTGDLSREFDPGTFCIDGEVQLLEIVKGDKTKSTEATVIPLKAHKVFREVFEYNDKSTKDSIPREFITEEQVAEVGGRISTWESGEGVFQPCLNLLLAIVLPKDEVSEDLDPYFIDEYKDERFAIVATRLMKSAYKEAGKQLLTDNARVLQRMGGLPFARYRLWNEDTRKGENYVWVPHLRRIPGSNPKELVQFFKDIIG